MAEFSPIDLFDPRGRVDRKGLALLAAVLIGAQSGVYGALFATGWHLPVGADVLINAVFVWISYAAVAKRLHDLGVSAARLVWATLGLVVFSLAVAFTVIFLLGEDAVMPGAIGYLLVAASVFLPVIA